MRRLIGLALLALMATCAGCFTETLPESALVPGTPSPLAAKALPPVTVGQLTEQNGHQIAQALDEELTREAQQHMLNPQAR